MSAAKTALPLVLLFLASIWRFPACAQGAALKASSVERGAETERLEEMADEMSHLMDELTPLLQRLELLKNSCLESCSFPSYSKEREILLSEIQPRLKRLHAQEREYDMARQAADITALAAAIIDATSGKSSPPGAGAQLAVSRQLKDFSKAVYDFRDNAHRLLDSDALAYQAAQKDFEKQRFFKRSSAALALLIIFSYGAVLWRKTARRPPPPTAPLQTGALLDSGYRIEAELGCGSLGTVYEATDTARGRKVALRRASTDAFCTSKARSRFLAQARRAAVLKHPHIVETYAVFEEAGQAFQAFELVHGRPLSVFIENGRRLPLRSAKGVIRQAAAALDYAHASNVIHGGLRISKFLLTPEDNLKLRDFGIAPYDSGFYSSPERGPGDEGASRESDIFALGALFYEMITGRPPYERDSLTQKQRMLFIPPSKLAPDIPAAADALVEKALAADPRARYRSVSELAAAVEAIEG